jgi:hypothetical protein
MTLVKGVAGPLESVARILSLVLTALFFLSLGSDTPGQFHLKLALGLVLFTLALAVCSQDRSLYSTRSVAFIFLLSFAGFLWVRFFVAFLIAIVGQTPPREIPMILRYLESPVSWSFALGLAASGFVFFRLRREVHRLLWLVSGLGFFIALNAVPRLLIGGAEKEIVTGYLGPDGRLSFFFPVFYFQPWVENLILSRAAHSNFAGDVIALGFFPCLSGFLYLLGRSLGSQRLKMSFLVLLGVFAGTMALGVTLFFSRGTILCFALALLAYTLAVLLKYPTNTRFIGVALTLAVVFGFVFWGGNVPGMVNELLTVPQEVGADEGKTSLAVSFEGARRAWKIYQTFPILGIGTGGYEVLASVYASPGSGWARLTDFTAMSHYLQLLAEEGAGAFFYFLFLFAYLVEMVRRLTQVHSHLQFLAGLALFVSVVMVLLHASIHHLMEGFSVSSLVYLYMGASLGILSQGFQHGRQRTGRT